MYRRNIMPRLEAALSDTRVVLLNGARQTGKSTLANELAKQRGGRYLTLDDEAVLSAVRSDPVAMLDSHSAFTVIDEIQRAPELFPAIKRDVDQDRRPGRYFLTGSANIFMVPRVSESLAGRMEILTLYPLSQDELSAASSDFLDELFSATPWRVEQTRLDRGLICERIIQGGFPESVSRISGERRSAWFAAYLSSLIQRDVRDLAGIDGLNDLPRLVGLLASRPAALMNTSELSRSLGIPYTTLRRYLGILEAIYVFQPLPAWSTNSGKRFVKAPKIHFNDTGLAAHLRGDTDPGELAGSRDLGHLLESFVVQEVRKQCSWHKRPPRCFHFRSAAGREVDLVLEMPGGRIAGVEIKASATVGPRDFGGLEALAAEAGRKFSKGIVLHLGEHVLPFSGNMTALPLTRLWQAGSGALRPR